MTRNPFLILSLAATLGACQAQAPAPATSSDPATLPFQVLHLGTQCGADSASVDRIADAAGLRQAIAGRTVGATPTVPAADFDRSLVLRLSMGQQPNPGHRLGVTGVRLQGASRRLIIDTVWATPEPGRMYATVITQPCVIVAVPRGDYGGVAVLDAQGRERMGAALTLR
ncbi:protease complex subunit PrcB family protein [Piscinibacter sp. HJYY11]|uniref:protease complex subunit PrcB family protein n=1 Tax=Piscinibacter sp. HJYY11 TaxID=2801333 RepID=UPI00191D973D|nr:protease complex subunit PrcB family protein [Piscinibacter sp. HJYY11]MBL0727445.1 protease complex subunit PrcB family protein [Piscinibacter sp. HJYY11]